MTDHTAALRERFGFWIDSTGTTRVIRWMAGGCRPSTTVENALWDALARPRHPIAWKTTHKSVCPPITEDKAIADAWREAGYPVVELFAQPQQPATPPAPAEPHGVPVLAAAMALLVAGGFVAQTKVDEAIQIALHTPGATEISANDAPPPQQPAQQGQDAREPERFVVLKASGSRYAYVNDTLLGKTVKRYDVLRGGWTNAELHAARLNRDHAMSAAQGDAAQGGGKNG